MNRREKARMNEIGTSRKLAVIAAGLLGFAAMEVSDRSSATAPEQGFVYKQLNDKESRDYLKMLGFGSPSLQESVKAFQKNRGMVVTGNIEDIERVLQWDMSDEARKGFPNARSK